MRWVCQKCGDEDVRIPHHTGEPTPRLLCAECYCDYLANELDFVEGELRRYKDAFLNERNVTLRLYSNIRKLLPENEP